MNILELEHVNAGYGAARVLHGIDLTVAQSGITALLGANGAGKTTTLRAVSNMIAFTGKMTFAGQALNALRTDQIAQLGLAHVPQGRGTLTRLSVVDNLQVGALRNRDRAQVAEDFELCYALFPKLRGLRTALAGNLSGGEQQMLAIARALMSRPRLLVLDEPSLGLAPKITREVFDALRELHAERQISMLIVEQNAALALELADWAVVLESGRVAIKGPAKELAGMDEVRAAYLGG
ncbi:MAG: ABC transporter ATP-binding protein [Rhodoferax sp.]|nr:ABC transporter ATP-binding protein [Rhodoferax sp.]